MSLLFRSSWINLVLHLNKKVIILCFNSFNKNGQKKRKLFPFSRFVRFVSGTPYTQGQHNVVNFLVSNTLSVHLHVLFQTNRHRKKKIQNRKPILPLQILKKPSFFLFFFYFYQETIASLTIWPILQISKFPKNTFLFDLSLNKYWLLA